MCWWGITKKNVKLTGTFCRGNGIFRTFVKIENSVNKQFYVNISTSDVFCWLNCMLRALCRKETTCCETYSRIVMLWSISQTRSNMFKTRCAKKVHSDNVLQEKLHVESTVQGRDDVFRRVAMRNDKYWETFCRGEGILWTFSQAGDSMVVMR